MYFSLPKLQACLVSLLSFAKLRVFWMNNSWLLNLSSRRILHWEYLLQRTEYNCFLQTTWLESVERPWLSTLIFKALGYLFDELWKNNPVLKVSKRATKFTNFQLMFVRKKNFYLRLECCCEQKSFLSWTEKKKRCFCFEPQRISSNRISTSK